MYHLGHEYSRYSFYETSQNNFFCSKKTRWFVTPVIIFTIVYNIPKFFELHLVYPPNSIECQTNSTQCIEKEILESVELKPTSMRINKVSIILHPSMVE